MEDVTIKRQALLEALKDNRDNHRAVFEAGVEEYQNRVIRELQQRIKSLRAGAKTNVHISLPEPEDHTLDYDRIIRMLEMTVDDEITISEYDFAQYVMDDWDWARGFARNTAAYAASNVKANPATRARAARLSAGV